MADSILRLKVESQEYDNKLKQATQGLTRYADECRKIGGTLEVVEKDTLDYVRALGQMDTTSRTATGKLAEMKKTFTELSVVYKNMTDEEKNSPFGKALATSLDQLKGRIQDSKSQLDDINKSVNGGGGLTGALDSLSDKFGMSIQSLAGWGTALAAGKAALDVAKDAFFASEETVDEWGRVMDSSKSLYEGFLTSLNTGDISGFLNRIDSIVQAARAAYNELDRLGTMKTIQAPQMSAQQTENERMRMMIQTGRYIAPVDGRRASMQNGQLLTPDQIKRIEQQLQGGMQKVVTLVGNEVAQTSRAIDAVYNRQAQELGMNLKEFRKGTSSMAEFDKRMAGYDQYQKWRAEHTTIDMQSGRETVARGNPFEQFAKWGTFRVDGDRYNDLVKLIQQRDQQAGQAYSMQSQAYRTMNRAEGVTLRQIMGGGSGGGGRSGGGTSEPTYAADSIAAQQKLVADLTRQWNEAGADVRNQYVQPLVEAEAKLKEMRDQQMLMKEQAQGKLLGDTQTTTITATVEIDDSEALEKLRDIEGITIDPKTLSVTAETQEALEKLRDIEGITIDPKTLSVTADTQEAIEKLRDIEGITIDPKTLSVTADTQEAIEKLRELKGVHLDESTVQTNTEIQSIEIPISSNVAFEVWMNGIKEQLANLEFEPIEIPIKTTEKDVMAIAKAASVTADVVGSIGDAFNSIEDPAAKVAGTVMQAIASVALGYAQATVQATSMGPWAWVAFAATGLATMLSTISAIHSATGYAQGGIVKGNSYSGDNIYGGPDAMVNAGELVLTKAQQGNLASQLQEGGMRNMNLSGRIRGTDIILSVDRTLSLEGKQLLTWGR